MLRMRLTSIQQAETTFNSGNMKQTNLQSIHQAKTRSIINSLHNIKQVAIPGCGIP